MSTITREWLQQRIADMEAARDEIPFGLDEDESDTLDALRIALASIEAEKGAEPVAKVDTVGVCWYADNGVSRKPAVSTELFAAPPVPVSVPDEATFGEMSFLGSSEATYVRGWNDCRAAMLQGAENAESRCSNSPMIPDGWVACSERMPETYVNVLLTDEHDDVCIGQMEFEGDAYFYVVWYPHRYKATHWMPLPAAPQQES